MFFINVDFFTVVVVYCLVNIAMVVYKSATILIPIEMNRPKASGESNSVEKCKTSLESWEWRPFSVRRGTCRQLWR